MLGPGSASEIYTYGASHQRLKTDKSTTRTYYAWGGSKVLVEYTEAVSSSTPAYSKVYYYAAERLVSSNEGTSVDYYHHPFDHIEDILEMISYRLSAVVRRLFCLFDDRQEVSIL